MKNKIEEQVKAYIDRPNTDYAVLINGEWGTGKTYFITNVIDWKDLCGTDKKIIYISLNGLSSLEEIKKYLFINTLHRKIRKRYSDLLKIIVI